MATWNYLGPTREYEIRALRREGNTCVEATCADVEFFGLYEIDPSADFPAHWLADFTDWDAANAEALRLLKINQTLALLRGE